MEIDPYVALAALAGPFVVCSFLYFAGPGQSGIGSSHLPVAIELTLFGLGTAAVLVGFLEMMMRERAGINRPGSPDIPLR